MLQGHFVDTLLDVSYRDPGHWLYATWNFMRGMTAPIFFFTSGMIFTFLLLKDSRPPKENLRVKKGTKRGLQLLWIGYLLKFNFIGFLGLYFSTGILKVDVLHCIGLALLSIIGLYHIRHHLNIPIHWLLLAAGLVVFLFNPDMEEADWSFLPLWLENYFSKANGSVFTPFPWIGYSLLGGSMGCLLHTKPDLAFSKRFPLAVALLGYLLHAYSSYTLEVLYYISGWDNLIAIANNNHLFIRLGHAMIVCSIAIVIAQWWKNMPELILKIGSETLLIYEVHYVLLYSTWFGIGLSFFWYRSLNPVQVIIGALLFLSFFVLLVAHWDKIREHYLPYFKRPFQRVFNRIKTEIAAFWVLIYTFLKKKWVRWRNTSESTSQHR